jgi:hypothetical protein
LSIGRYLSIYTYILPAMGEIIGNRSQHTPTVTVCMKSNRWVRHVHSPSASTYICRVLSFLTSDSRSVMARPPYFNVDCTVSQIPAGASSDVNIEEGAGSSASAIGDYEIEALRSECIAAQIYGSAAWERDSRLFLPWTESILLSLGTQDGVPHPKTGTRGAISSAIHVVYAL